MSIPKRVTVTCPKCGKPFQVTVFESVNTDYAEDIAQQIISGELFEAKCTSCGFVANLAYNVLYHDMKHGAMIWLVHPEEDYAKKIAEIRSTNLLPYEVTRIVQTVDQLREKVACLEKNRDDRVIEILKLLALAQASSSDPAGRAFDAFYTLSANMEKELIYVHADDGEQLQAHLDGDNYEKIKCEYAVALSSHQEEPYQIIDQEWALDFLLKHERLERNESERSSTAVAANNDTPSEIRFCRKCGTKLLENAMFCHRCGADVLLK